MQNVLVVAFHFPPIAAAGTHRTLNFVRILRRRGYRLGVLSTSSTSGLATDPSLLDRVPADVAVERSFHIDPYLLLARLRGARDGEPVAAAMPSGDGPAAVGASGSAVHTAVDYLSRLANLPDRYSTWIPTAVARGVLLGRRIGAQVMYSTAPPYSAHVVGLFLSRILDIPWVVDLRDPWILNPFHSNPYRSLRRADAAIETAVVRRAARVILNTEQAEAGYRRRYPDLDRFCTITNGIDPDLLADPPLAVPDNGRLRLLHIGAIYGRRYPAGLIQALAGLRERDRPLFERVHVEQIGPVDERNRLENEVRRQRLDGQVVVSAAVSHQQAFQSCRRASGLLLLGPSGSQPELQVPSKVYEYLAAGRPILALAKQDGAIASILRSAGGAYVLADPDDVPAIQAGLAEIDRLSRNPSDPERSGLEPFTYESLTSALERQLRLATGLPPDLVAADSPLAGG